jgi:hypothetical protein
MKQFFTLLAAVFISASTFAQVGINTEIPDASSALDITSNTGGLLTPRMTAAQRDAITSPSQGLIIFCTDCASGAGELQIKLSTAWKNLPVGVVNDPLPVIGEFYQGGIVFYLDGSGGGLIAAPTDQTNSPWGCSGIFISGADGTAIGTGAQNTIDIESGCSETAIAAKICADLTLGGYTDWFLPSQDELNQMYLKRGIINTTATANGGGNFAPNGIYRSSTEHSSTQAKIHSFSDNSAGPGSKTTPYQVRAIRAF